MSTPIAQDPESRVRVKQCLDASEPLSRITLRIGAVATFPIAVNLGGLDSIAFDVAPARRLGMSLVRCDVAAAEGNRLQLNPCGERS